MSVLLLRPAMAAMRMKTCLPSRPACSGVRRVGRPAGRHTKVGGPGAQQLASRVRGLVAVAAEAEATTRVAEEEKEEGEGKPTTVTPEKEVELKSGVGFDYGPLRDALAEGDFYKADEIHRAALITVVRCLPRRRRETRATARADAPALGTAHHPTTNPFRDQAGEDAEARGWVYFTEIRSMPVEDLQTMDNLWSAYSGGKFGFTEQRRIWLKCNKRWEKFYKAIDWVTGENNNYRKWATKEYFYTLEEACAGHLPLTNALRGTNLLEEILVHPAFAASEESKASAKKKSSLLESFGQVKKLF